uniref:Retrotransposon gag domain-containing protein n=1 Tax=Moniliophthora roreri TaxID=221103 RepID=A0A0W0GFS0_MONRR
MTTPSRSTDVKPDVKKEESSSQQWAVQIATSVVEAIDEKKEDLSKGPIPEPYEGDHKDTRQFLFDLELYFKMNPSKGNTDKKKKMILLSLLKGKTTEWKMTEQEQLFPEDDDPEEKKKAAEETWSVFENRFKKHWQPVDVAGDTQMRIRDLQMKECADDYTGYDDVTLMTFFKEGLVPSLQDKIMLRSEEPPETLDKWYEIAIRYDNQYKFTMANKKRRQPKETIKPKINRKEKEVVINRTFPLSDSDKKDYMVQGKCFQCAQISHIS